MVEQQAQSTDPTTVSTVIPRAQRTHEQSVAAAAAPTVIRGKGAPVSGIVALALSGLTIPAVIAFWGWAWYAHTMIYFAGTRDIPMGDGTESVHGSPYAFYADPFSVLALAGTFVPLLLALLSLFVSARENRRGSAFAVSFTALIVNFVLFFAVVRGCLYLGS